MGKRISIIGAGPGGLTAAMILGNNGYDIEIFEKECKPGGRNASIYIDGYSFDIGPTFLMMTFILEDMFRRAGRNIKDYLKIYPLDPMYRLTFGEKVIHPTGDHVKMQKQIDEVFPGNEGKVAEFIKKEKIRYDKMFPCLQKEYGSLGTMVSWILIKALPHLSIGKSLYDVLGDYFNTEDLRIAFTFQAKYLGMSPWQCPGLFTMIPFVEHEFGIDHVEGGLSKISEAMAKVCREQNTKIHYNTAVKNVIVQDGKARGVVVENGNEFYSDAVVINADFGHAMSTLFKPGVIKKWTPEKLKKKKYSCSTFMLYLGLDKLYDEPHHHILFADNYKNNIDDIVYNRPPSEDMSIYIRNAGINDSTLAPIGHSTLYVLVPVANSLSNTDWSDDFTKAYRDRVIKRIVEKTSMKDLSKHIKAEKVITPKTWINEYNLFLGSTFNLGHNLRQMLILRPHNKFEEIKNCYLVGGGTHPGSGLPTIYESGRISSDLIMQDIN
ncbi:MAG: phytoene desaturase family protein [Chitinispirillia bacterium]|jgi:phytoene desaturase